MKASRIVALIISILIAGCLIYYFSNIVSYVLIAWVISMIGAPLMSLFLEKMKLKRFRFGSTLAAMLTLLVFALAVGTLLMVFVPLVVEQARNLSQIDYYAIGQSLSEPLDQINNLLYRWGLIGEIKPPGDQISNLAKDWINPDIMSNLFGSILGLAGNALIAIFSVIFVSFFFLKENGLFTYFVQSLVPRGDEDKTVKTIDEISYLLTRYFAGVVVQVTIITIFVSAGLSIFGVENALLIGFFAGVINVIPYVGPMIGAAFGTLVTISANLDLEFYNQMLPLILKVLAVFASMQMLDNFVLQPFIFSNSVKAHPLEIFIVILVGAQLGGILGMVLAIPTYTVLRVIAKVFMSELKFVQQITSRMDRAE